jgi:hypothetical protein
MTLTEANSALRLYGLKMDRVLMDVEDGVETFQYTVASDHIIHSIGTWTMPIQEVYEYVVENFT